MEYNKVLNVDIIEQHLSKDVSNWPLKWNLRTTDVKMFPVELDSFQCYLGDKSIAMWCYRLNKNSHLLGPKWTQTWWCHQMETSPALLDICVGNSPVTGEFPAQRPVTRSFDVLFDLRLNKRLSKQWLGWWFEMPSRPLWRHCNAWALAVQYKRYSRPITLSSTAAEHTYTRGVD